jgi:type IV secretion system protein VirB5
MEESMKKLAKLAAAVALALAAHSSALAITTVIDPAVLRQSIQQVHAWSQQYQQMQSQIAQLQQARAAMSGDRGMAGLLGSQNRGYLPANWNHAMTTLDQGGTSYTALANVVRQIKEAQAVLSQQEVGRMTPQMQQYLEQTRNLAASQQALGQSAYNTAAQRVQTLQALTNALNNQVDPKAVMDLQARIASEQTALANDQAQLQAVAQLTTAQAIAQQGMANEIRAQTAGNGDFPRVRPRMPY